MGKLFEPFVINGVTLKNRIIMSGMHTEYGESGALSPQELSYYEERAKGGAAAIGVVSKVSEYGGPETMQGVYDDSFEGDIRQLAKRLHAYDCKLFIHLFHIGRNHGEDILGHKLIAPSPVPSPIYRYMPREMTLEDIEGVKMEFARAAARCRRWGADGVLVNCSAGYLLSLFLSEETNKRQDAYGGSQENRFRFPYEVLAAVREAVGPDYPVMVKLSGSSMREQGYGLMEMEAFSQKIATVVDAIGVTGGWHEAAVPQITYQVPKGFYSFLSFRIKEKSGLPVICYNRINDRETAELILEEEKADLVACGRAFLADPYFAKKLQEGESYHQCIGCNRGCMDRIIRNKDVRCIQNPELGREYLRAETAGMESRKAWVIGGGPGGMSAAKYLRLRGFEVTLQEKAEFLGGAIPLAAKSEGKGDYGKIAEALEYDVRSLGVTIRLGTPATKEQIEAEGTGYDLVVVATGGKPRKVFGDSSNFVLNANDVLAGDYKLWNKLNSSKVVIIGADATALETALFLANKRWLKDEQELFYYKYIPEELKAKFESSASITLVEKERKAGRNLGGTRFIVMGELKKNHVQILTETEVVSVENGRVIVQKGDTTQCLEAEYVIEAVGELPDNSLEESLKENGCNYVVIGDANGIGDIEKAIAEGYRAAWSV